MGARSSARLEFWLSIAAVIAASAAALPRAPHLLCAGLALMLFAFAIGLRVRALRGSRNKGSDAAERARRIREARPRR